MTANHKLVWMLACGSLALLWVAGAPPDLSAAELPPLTASVPPEEALAAIKRRAMKILEARRSARRLKLSGELSETVAYETNPANSSSRKGDTMFEESAYVLLSKKLSPTLDWQSSYSGVYDKYLEYGDGDYTDHTLTATKLRWVPGRRWRLEWWTDIEYNYYPTANDSSYRNLKTVGRLRQNLLKSWYHQIQYEWFLRDYTRKNARDGAGAETRNDRKDIRHRIRYKVGTTVKDALLSMENEYYWNDSNDARTDFYDSQVCKVTGSVSGNVTKKLYASASYAFERKNYDKRTVSGIDAEARYDDKTTLSSSASYDLNETWKIAYALTFDHLGSNEPTGEYDNTKHALTVTAKF
ncbi:MAG: hypothetical protein HYZ91_01845 [Candidatus Omnitrophica bacterium]|nr:hypothetical protein [Candidatus Omnitrophota bacterium]